MHVNLLQHCVQAIDMFINLAITLQWTFTDTSTPKRAKQSRPPMSGKWIARFEDGSEDKCDDPAVDETTHLLMTSCSRTCSA